MTLEISVTLPEELYQELIEAAREAQCSPKQFATECVEAALATRRLPRARELSREEVLGRRNVLQRGERVVTACEE